jgi:ABC-type nitrate/sulfonate/bicarbonate transport system substrate-binding protein
MFAQRPRIRLARAFPIASIAAAALILAADAAGAQTIVRVGKAQINQFGFVPADVGVDTGLFKKQGLDVRISAFAGDAKLMQALAAGGVDIALGGGPALAAIAKGAPMKAVAAAINAPNIIMLVVLNDGPVRSVADLKGRRVSVSTEGSLTFWLTQQLSRARGWGDNGIRITPLGSSEAQIAALRTQQVDGVTTDSVTVHRFVESGDGRILVKFGDYVKNFHSGLIYASNNLIKNDPAALRAFLAGWFQAVAYMHGHRQAAIEVAIKHTGVSPAAADAGYDDTMPVMSTDGRFDPKALNVLATSFVEMHMLPAKPEMSTLVSEAFLPK